MSIPDAKDAEDREYEFLVHHLGVCDGPGICVHCANDQGAQSEDEK